MKVEEYLAFYPQMKKVMPLIEREMNHWYPLGLHKEVHIDPENGQKDLEISGIVDSEPKGDDCYVNDSFIDYMAEKYFGVNCSIFFRERHVDEGQRLMSNG